MHKNLVVIARLAVLVVLLAGCRSWKEAKKDLVYLRHGNLDTLPNLTVPVKEAIIQPEDLLSIVVYSDNPEATTFYNQPGLATGGKIVSDPTVSQKTSGYLVDRFGEIRMQGIGTLKVGGLTRLALIDTLTLRLTRFLTNPTVDVRFLNARVTVIGEVQKPGVYNLPGEKMSILELVGLAGDITIYGKRDNILVIREQQGKREFGRLNLSDANAFQSPYFYLQQNDMVLVEPSSKKPTATEQETLRRMTMITSFATLASAFAILITIFK